MMKPWLLCSDEEKKARMDFYNEFIKDNWPLIDEGIEVMLRPPRNKLDALFELYLYQPVNKKRKDE